MARSRLLYVAAADRWEAVPIDEAIVDVIEVDAHVRLFVGDGGVNGFAIDADGDLGSRLEVLGRYVVVDEMRARFESEPTGGVDVEIDVDDRAQFPTRNALATIEPRTVVAPRRVSSLVRVGVRSGQVTVAVSARW